MDWVISFAHNFVSPRQAGFRTEDATFDFLHYPKVLPNDPSFSELRIAQHFTLFNSALKQFTKTYVMLR
jgi:hypothetical protein